MILLAIDSYIDIICIINALFARYVNYCGSDSIILKIDKLENILCFYPIVRSL